MKYEQDSLASFLSVSIQNVLWILILGYLPMIANAQTHTSEEDDIEVESDYDASEDPDYVDSEIEWYAAWHDSFPVKEQESLDTAWLDKWQKNESFRYANDSSYFNSKKYAGWTPSIPVLNSGKIFSWVVIIVLMIGLGYWINKYTRFTIFKPKPAALNHQTIASHETVNLQQLLSQSIQNADYRSAVRYQYLILLEQLVDKGYLKKKQIQHGEINLAISDSQKLQTFHLLTRIYQYIWYGEYSITTEHFNEVNLIFSSFTQSLRYQQ